MNAECAPWFPFYVADFWSSPVVQEMGLAGAGAYVRLLSYEWQTGSIPSEPAKLARILGVTRDEMAEIWSSLRSCFAEMPGDDLRLINVRLEEERTKAYAKSERLRAAGSAGGRKKAERSKILASLEDKSASATAICGSAVAEGPSLSTNELLYPSDAIAQKPSDATIYATPHTTIGVFAKAHTPSAAIAPTVVDASASGVGLTLLPGGLDVTNPPASREEGGKREALPLQLETQASSPKIDARRARSPEDVAAHDILDAAWPVIVRQHQDYPETAKAWRQKNKAAAVKLAVKLSPERVVGLLAYAFSDPEACRFYGGLTSLHGLIEAIPRLSAMKRGETGRKPLKSMTGATGLQVR